MQADHARRCTYIEVALHRLLNGQAKCGQVIGFGKDGFAQGASDVAALRCILDKKDDFAQGRDLLLGSIMPTWSAPQRSSAVDQSPVNPEAFTIGAHRSLSRLAIAAKSAALPPVGSRPSLAKRSDTSDAARALLIAALICVTVAAEVLAGA